MKILIAYSSQTGNTKKICIGVYDELKKEFDIDIMPVKEVKDYKKYDVIIPGFWVDKASVNKDAKKFIKTIRNKTVILIGTLGADPKSRHGNQSKKNAGKFVDASNNYKGVFLSRGKVSKQMMKIINLFPSSFDIKKQSLQSREPNEEDIKRASDFIRNKLEGDNEI